MMKTEKKVIIRVDSGEEESVKTGRRTLKFIQNSATDKENFVGRPQGTKDVKASVGIEKRRKLLMQNKSTQTGESVVTAEDLTSDEPSVDYWRKLAETRGDALNSSIQEIEMLKEDNETLKEEREKLKEDCETLKEENKTCKEMLEEARTLVDVLQEMLDDKDDDDGDKTGEEATENVSS